MTTKKLGFDAKLDIVYNYYLRYADYFHTTCNITCVDLKMHASDYWELFHGDIWKYLHNIAVTENHWADHLIKLAQNGRPKPDFTEEERFLYWFLIHTYRIDGYTDFKELKRRFRTDYKKCRELSRNK